MFVKCVLSAESHVMSEGISVTDQLVVYLVCLPLIVGLVGYLCDEKFSTSYKNGLIFGFGIIGIVFIGAVVCTLIDYIF